MNINKIRDHTLLNRRRGIDIYIYKKYIYPMLEMY